MYYRCIIRGYYGIDGRGRFRYKWRILIHDIHAALWAFGYNRHVAEKWGLLRPFRGELGLI